MRGLIRSALTLWVSEDVDGLVEVVQFGDSQPQTGVQQPYADVHMPCDSVPGRPCVHAAGRCDAVYPSCWDGRNATSGLAALATGSDGYQ